MMKSDYDTALDPNTSPALLAVWASDSRLHIRQAVAQNPSTLPRELAKLAFDPDLWVRHYVANNPSTPLENQNPLDKDEPDVKKWSNP
jgi:hypothetical protein